MLKTLACLAFAFVLPGEPCSDLTVTGTGQGGTNLVFALDGAAPRSPALLVMGETTGQFSINIGQLGTLELGLVPPFSLVPLGFTDANGDATATFRVPRNLPPTSLHGQAFTVEFDFRTPALDFCTSDVVSFNVGG